MNIVDWHPEDLIDLRLQGTLTDEQRLELEAHVKGCDVCRFELLLADDLDAEQTGAPPHHDSASLARLIGVAVEGEADPRGSRPSRCDDTNPASSRRKRTVVVTTLGAALLFAGSAAALYGLDAGAPTQPLSQAVPTAKEGSASSAPPPTPARAVATPSVHGQPTEEVTPPNIAPSSRSHPAPATSAHAATAASLFSRANEARRRGDVERATALYRSLRQRFPDTQEAKLSRALEGRMLQQRDPKGALDAYDSYLEQGDDTVSEEALLGRAVALERMGRPVEERAAWHELLTKFPQSIHAGRARSRLAVLERHDDDTD